MSGLEEKFSSDEVLREALETIVDKQQEISRAQVSLGRLVESIAEKVRPDRVRFRSIAAAPELDDAALLRLTKHAYAVRRQRAKIFPSELFSEPAWDILLDLFAASLEKKRVSVTSACLGADVPPTTGLRYLAALEKDGLIEREPDYRDRRRTWLSLTKKGTMGMKKFFEIYAARFGHF